MLASASQPTPTEQARLAAIQSIQLRFRVDRAIAGVEVSEILTIHEWAAAWSMPHPMLRGSTHFAFSISAESFGVYHSRGWSARPDCIRRRRENRRGKKIRGNVEARSDAAPRMRAAGLTQTVAMVVIVTGAAMRVEVHRLNSTRRKAPSNSGA